MIADWAFVVLRGVPVDVLVVIVKTPLPLVSLPAKAFEAFGVLVNVLLVYLQLIR